MTAGRITPLRLRMIENIRIRGMGGKAQNLHIQAVKDFTAFLAIGGYGPAEKTARLSV